MAIAFNASADLGNNGGRTASLTASYTVGSATNRLLVVGLVGDVIGGADDVTSVTYAGAPMTLAVKNTTGNNRYTYLYFLLNPTSGANNVVISCASLHFIIAGAADYTGVAQSGQPDATVANASASAGAITLTTSITTVADNCWAIGVATDYSAGDHPTSGSGDAMRSVDGTYGNWGLFDSNGAIHPAGSYGMTTNWSGASTNYRYMHTIASFAPFTSAATTLTIDVPGPVEFSRALGGRASLSVETPAGQRRGSGIPSEAVAVARGDNISPVELRGTVGVASDILGLLEWSARTSTGRGLPVEFGGRIGSDGAFSAEWLTRAAVDPYAAAEWLGWLLLETGAPGELSAAIAAGDALVPGEWQGAILSLLMARAPTPLEWSIRPASQGWPLIIPGKGRLLATPGRLRLLKRT